MGKYKEGAAVMLKFKGKEKKREKKGKANELIIVFSSGSFSLIATSFISGMRAKHKKKVGRGGPLEFFFC